MDICLHNVTIIPKKRGKGQPLTQKVKKSYFTACTSGADDGGIYDFQQYTYR